MTAANAPTQRFSSRVDDYVRYRPGYPAALMSWLRDLHGVDAGWRVADIGAGTGISTRMWADAGHDVIAVEPNDAMRTAARDAQPASTRVTWVAATAEATTLDNDSVGLVSAAQAFHWFDTAAVHREWARILRHDGLAVVFWNSRLLDGSVFLTGYEALLREYGIDYDAVAERYQDDATMAAWFGDGFAGSARFDNLQRLDFEQLRGRLLSSSYVPQADDPRFDAMLDALRTLFDRCAAADGQIDFVYCTRVFVGRLH